MCALARRAVLAKRNAEKRPTEMRSRGANRERPSVSERLSTILFHQFASQFPIRAKSPLHLSKGALEPHDAVGRLARTQATVLFRRSGVVTRYELLSHSHPKSVPFLRIEIDIAGAANAPGMAGQSDAVGLPATGMSRDRRYHHYASSALTRYSSTSFLVYLNSLNS